MYHLECHTEDRCQNCSCNIETEVEKAIERFQRKNYYEGENMRKIDGD